MASYASAKKHVAILGLMRYFLLKDLVLLRQGLHSLLVQITHLGVRIFSFPSNVAPSVSFEESCAVPSSQ